MNAAARELRHLSVFYGHVKGVKPSRSLLLQMILLLTLLTSALSVVYTTNLQRMTLSQLAFAQQEAHQLEMQWGQLLLEHASLATPSRIQTLAHKKLHMVLPGEKQTVIVRDDAV